jgi:hypothetical protein
MQATSRGLAEEIKWVFARYDHASAVPRREVKSRYRLLPFAGWISAHDAPIRGRRMTHRTGARVITNAAHHFGFSILH